MKRFWGHAFVAVVSLAGIGVIGSACAHNDQSIFIRQVMAPPTVAIGTQCVYTPDPTLQELGSGILDVSLTNRYTAVLLVGNQLVPQANPDQARTESNRVELQGATVTVVNAGDLPGISANTTLQSFTVNAVGFADPGTGGTPSYGLLIADILEFDKITTSLPIPANGGSVTLVAHVKAFGETLGRTSVETNEFDFPIDVCSGCLVSFPTGSADPLQAMPNCLGSTTMTTGSTGMIVQPCFLGQDQTVDCRLCQGKPACIPK
jgi:hypothetical protein